MGVVERIRKTAALEEGRRSFEQLTSSCAPRAIDVVLMRKAAAADPIILAVAARIRPDRPLATYANIWGE